jgi:hypothetical protein
MLNTRASAVAACLALITCGGSTPPIGSTSTAVAPQEKPSFPPIPPASDFDTTPEHSDFRRLMIGNCPESCRPGPLAWIQPRMAAALWSAEHRDSGEVIARIISEGGYPKFNIHDRKGGPDTVYWAVVKRGNTLVSVFRSTTPGSRDIVSKVEVYPHGQGFFRGISLARWIWSDRDDMAWGTCDGGACCKSDGIPLQ